MNLNIVTIVIGDKKWLITQNSTLRLKAID